jgi:PII-like signaling protein
MKGCSLRFYLHEHQRHHGMPLYEWLLEQAKRAGIPGGSAFRAIAGFGRHGVLSEQHFFELAGQLTVVVEFIVTDAQADTLLAIARADGANLFHARIPAEFGLLGEGGTG